MRWPRPWRRATWRSSRRRSSTPSPPSGGPPAITSARSPPPTPRRRPPRRPPHTGRSCTSTPSGPRPSTPAWPTRWPPCPTGRARTAASPWAEPSPTRSSRCARAMAGTDHVVDSPGSGPGTWRPTPPRLDAPLLPQWATVRPFVLASPRQFRPPGPPGLGSRAWADAYDEVKAIGRADGASRTAEQTQIARLWADGMGTYTPPGHWNQIAAQVAQDAGNGLTANARLFAALNLALADAAIACWDAKYAYRFWRPVTAIGAADTDGHPDTEADPSWAPLLTTPNFPEYISGHSTFSGAAEVVLSSLLRPGRRVQHLLGRASGGHSLLHELRRRRRGGRPEPALRRHPLPVLEPGRPRHRPCRGPPCARRPRRRHRRPAARSRGRCPGPQPVSSRAIPQLGRFRWSAVGSDQRVAPAAGPDEEVPAYPPYERPPSARPRDIAHRRRWAWCRVDRAGGGTSRSRGHDVGRTRNTSGRSITRRPGERLIGPWAQGRWIEHAAVGPARPRSRTPSTEGFPRIERAWSTRRSPAVDLLVEVQPKANHT